MKKKIILALLMSFALLTGCGGKSDSSSSESTQKAAATTAPTTTSPVVTEKQEVVLPSVDNKSGKVQIQTVSGSLSYKYNSYVITSSKGESIVLDPTSMPTKEIVDLKPAAIVNTHGHEDHTDKKYSDSYDCQKIKYTRADIKTKDFHIVTIPSSHNGDTVDDNTFNVIIIVEVDGLRIAHMGDIGQTKLTDEQKKALGKIDIAFMQLENSYSSMTLDNAKGFNLLEEFKPTMVIPTHYTPAADSVIEQKYGKITTVENILQISKKDLPQKALTFYHIANTHFYG